MLVHRKIDHPIYFTFFLLIFTFVLLASCTTISPLDESIVTVPTSAISEIAQYPKAEVTFEVQTIHLLDEDQNLYVEFLDEVTGLAMNPARVKMEKIDENVYSLKTPIIVGSVVKYRYVRDNDPATIEYSSIGKQVRYRLYFVDGPGIVKDVINAWKSSPFVGKTGRIHGRISVKGSNAPVVNALISAGGIQTLSASDGSFIVEGLPSGTHNLVIYDLNGAFQTFQQGAVIAPNSTTPALVQVIPELSVNVTFLVTPPADNISGIPIRIVGNIQSLGNSFADLAGGMSIIPSRSPLLAILPDGRYSITLKLPTGLDLRYKYSLGDGFWNAERSTTGEARLRQLIVPGQDITLEETIDTWRTTNHTPATFSVTVPQNTPLSDTISIQFNPFTWTVPIPMWPAGNNRWFYILYNPLDNIQETTYRFCRNDQCGLGDSVDTKGHSAPGISITPGDGEPNYDNSIESWAWLDSKTDPVVIPPVDITPRDRSFTAGVEFLSDYHPSWHPFIGPALQNIHDIGSNTVIISPTWHITHQSPPVFEAIPGSDALWPDLTQMVTEAQRKGLGVVIHPVIRYSDNPAEWWQGATRDSDWWQSWFDRYRTFILHHADLAAQTGAKTLVIGDEDLLPALPGGILADGTSSNIPSDANDRWEQLITDIRSRYTGKLAWFVPYSGRYPGIPDFASELDSIYVQLMPPFLSTDMYTQADLEASFSNILDSDVLEMHEKWGQPIVVGLKIPSISGVIDSCVDSSNGCLSLSSFSMPGGEFSNTKLDLLVQADVHTAVLTVINQRPWISGFYSTGYFPPVSLRDNSISIHGKPASDVLWYWYPRFLGATQP